jgi:hypothetical protein
MKAWYINPLSLGEMIAFSICNKSFKPLRLPSGWVKSREGLPGMIPTNNLKHYVVDKHGLPHKHVVHTSWAGLIKWTSQSYQDIKNQSTQSWKIETTYGQINVNLT